MSTRTRAHAVSDAVTMVRRSLKHAQRHPAMTLTVTGTPVLLLLLFRYGFGGPLGNGLRATPAAGAAYIDYLAPGIILLAAASGTLVTAVGVCVDRTEGLVDRFRTMAISRGSFLTGHVVGGVLQAMFGIVLVTGVAVLAGFRPDATLVEWAAALGVLALLSLALTWLAAVVGLVARTPETASNVPVPVWFLPLLGSAVVPPESMPGGLRWFAGHQPFTPVTETLRGLLTGTEIGASGPYALAWCAGLALAGCACARVLRERGAAAGA